MQLSWQVGAGFSSGKGARQISAGTAVVGEDVATLVFEPRFFRVLRLKKD